MKNFLALQVFLLLVLSSGCSQNRIHVLHNQNESETALLMISGGLNVNSVDEETPSVFSGGNIFQVWQYPDKLEILPGLHKIKVSSKGGLLDSKPLTFMSLNAKAGHTYIIGAIIYVSKSTGRKAWRAAIVDKGVGYSGGCSAEPAYNSVK